MHDQVRPGKETDCGSGDCGSGKRNRFFRGKQMKAEAFDTEQRYFIGRRRLVNRAVLGWGVVYGFALTGPRVEAEPGGYGEPPAGDAPQDPKYPKKDPVPDGKPDQKTDQKPEYKPEPKPPYGKTEPPKAEPFSVGRGFALDRAGREIVLLGPATLGVKNTFVLEPGCVTRSIDKITPGSYVLAVHYAERPTGHAHTSDDCGCAKPEKSFVCETAVFSLRRLYGDCPCAEEDCERSCKCGGTSSCCVGRGPHACLCQWVAGAVVADEATPLCEWKEHWLDPEDGVDLACVRVGDPPDRCTPLALSIEDDCAPRRLVKNNDLLYDLLRGCDLTRIEWISWHEWHRSLDQVTWDRFSGMFKEDGTTDFVVRFSGPVLEKTLRRDVVTMSAVTTEQATGWRVSRLVPIVDLDLTPDPASLKGYPSLPAGTTNQMRFKVRPEWIRDEIERGRESWLSERNFRIEIEIHGDLILDCHEQAVDANAVGLRPAPTGNGTPGGTFLSNFRVEHKKRDRSYDAA